MSTTVADILTAVAYRRRENSTPDNTNEVARRIRFIAEAQRKVIGRAAFWFTEKITSRAVETAQNEYSLPSDYRAMIDLRVDGIKHNERSQSQVLNAYTQPVSAYANTNYYVGEKLFYILNDKYTLIPTPQTVPSVVNVSSITSSGTTCTVTTASAHGYSTGDYVVIAGAVETAYNGTFRVVQLSSTTFKYTADSTPSASPATGTITATKNNIVIRYFHFPAKLTASTDTITIPDSYAACLDAYCFARMAIHDGKRGDAADAFDEFNEIVSELIEENSRRKYGNKVISAEDYLL